MLDVDVNEVPLQRGQFAFISVSSGESIYRMPNDQKARDSFNVQVIGMTRGNFPSTLFRIDVSDKFCYQTDGVTKLGGGVWGL